MRKLLGHIKGDKVLWGLVVLMGILSFMPVYSAASNLEFVVNNGTTISHLFKHAVMVFIGLAFMIFKQGEVLSVLQASANNNIIPASGGL